MRCRVCGGIIYGEPVLVTGYDTEAYHAECYGEPIRESQQEEMMERSLDGKVTGFALTTTVAKDPLSSGVRMTRQVVPNTHDLTIQVEARGDGLPPYRSAVRITWQREPHKCPGLKARNGKVKLQEGAWLLTSCRGRNRRKYSWNDAKHCPQCGHDLNKPDRE